MMKKKCNQNDPTEKEKEKIDEFSLLEKPELIERILMLEELCEKLVKVNNQFESFLQKAMMK